MAEEIVPSLDEEYEAFMGICMQEQTATMPDMAARREHCQEQWDDMHPHSHGAARKTAPYHPRN